MANEQSDPIFHMFHRYNKLVRRNLVQPLSCKTCETDLITGLGKDDTLVLKCMFCQSTTTPGGETLSRVRAVVSEHFMEN